MGVQLVSGDALLVALFLPRSVHARASNYSIPPSAWASMRSHLLPDLTFHSVPPGTAIPVGGKLLSVRHKQLSSLSDLDDAGEQLGELSSQA